MDIVVQPRDLGTGPGVLLPLARILAREPTARVIVSPSDHYVGRPLSFEQALRTLDLAADRAPDAITLIGVAPDRPAPDLGWLMPGEPMEEAGVRSLRSLHRFVEKPPESTAMLLLASGGLWNTLVLGSSLRSLWSLARRWLPAQTTCFEEYARQVGGANEGRVLQALYNDMLPADFSREVLQPGGCLAVLTALDCDWSDWGTPERVFRSLDGTPHLEALVDRIVARARIENAQSMRAASGLPGRMMASA